MCACRRYRPARGGACFIAPCRGGGGVLGRASDVTDVTSRSGRVSRAATGGKGGAVLLSAEGFVRSLGSIGRIVMQPVGAPSGPWNRSSFPRDATSPHASCWSISLSISSHFCGTNQCLLHYIYLYSIECAIAGPVKPRDAPAARI